MTTIVKPISYLVEIVKSSFTRLGSLLGAGMLLFLLAGCVALDLDDLGTASPVILPANKGLQK